MARKKANISELKRLVCEYRAGRLSPEIIVEIEKNNGMYIEELVSKIEMALRKRSHCLGFMTLTELKRWDKSKCTLTVKEKEEYAEANGCSYEEFEKIAEERLEQLQVMSWEKKMRRQIKETEELRVYLQGLVEKGLATTEDGVRYEVPSENAIYYV